LIEAVLKEMSMLSFSLSLFDPCAHAQLSLHPSPPCAQSKHCGLSAQTNSTLSHSSPSTVPGTTCLCPLPGSLGDPVAAAHILPQSSQIRNLSLPYYIVQAPLVYSCSTTTERGKAVVVCLRYYTKYKINYLTRLS
jgi:hypothetical protein